MIEIFGSQSPTARTAAAGARHLDRPLQHGFGIAIAIPALIFYRHYKNKVDTFVVEMELLARSSSTSCHGERVDYPSLRA